MTVANPEGGNAPDVPRDHSGSSRRTMHRGHQWLNGAQRYVAGAVGASALAASGFAVFKSTNGLGTVGLQAAGALFLFLGLTGLIPKRLTVGGNSVEYGDFAEAVVEEALESGEPEVREAVARHVLETADRRGIEVEGSANANEARRLTERAKRELHGLETMAVLRRNLPPGTVEFPESRHSSDRKLVFGPPSAPPSRQVAVTVMYAPLRREWLENYRSSALRSPFGCYVYVGAGSELPLVASVQPPLLAIAWNDSSETPALRRALEQALHIAEIGQVPGELVREGRGG